jgi:hypothetical protein
MLPQEDNELLLQQRLLLMLHLQLVLLLLLLPQVCTGLCKAGLLLLPVLLLLS